MRLCLFDHADFSRTKYKQKKVDWLDNESGCKGENYKTLLNLRILQPNNNYKLLIDLKQHNDYSFILNLSRVHG